MKGKILALTLGALLMLATAGSAIAAPKPPTNAGNGAGMSGQCTGPVTERPHSCQAFK